MDEVALPDVAARTVEAWRIEDGRLELTFSGGDAPRVLRCVCLRGHWIVETLVREGRAWLRVRCHACGRGTDLSLLAVPEAV